TQSKLELTLSQHTPATPGQTDKQAFDMPVGVALFADDGGMLDGPSTLRLQQDSQRWTFDDITRQPTLSVLRGFTAPVMIEYQQSDTELARLMAHDSDPVCRWDAAQQLYLNTLVAGVTARSSGDEPPAASEALFEAVAVLLDNPPQD